MTTMDTSELRFRWSSAQVQGVSGLPLPLAPCSVSGGGSLGGSPPLIPNSRIPEEETPPLPPRFEHIVVVQGGGSGLSRHPSEVSAPRQRRMVSKPGPAEQHDADTPTHAGFLQLSDLTLKV